jgi:light-regulated signal transduction histidine kinase (bacteriophytochrome)
VRPARPPALEHAYCSALEAYLEQPDEVALSVAYELGRRALAEDLGVLDLAFVHEQALETHRRQGPRRDDTRDASLAADFFRELLSPFEMALRGYRAANEELARMNAELRLQKDEQTRLNEAIKRQKDALEIVNRELESFSYSVSHDLRAPLRAIDGFSQALLDDCGDKLDEMGRRHLARVREAAARMSQLIEDLLGLAHVTRRAVNRSEVDLTAVARRASEQLRSRDPSRDVNFVIQSNLRAQVDGRLVTIVLENLLGNAFKFTAKRAQARIEFGCTEQNGQVVYFVRDNGAGFDMNYAQRLFSPFQRLHATQDFEGTGVGLATVQRIVHRHEGRIWAEAAVGAGAAFYFTLSGA